MKGFFLSMKQLIIDSIRSDFIELVERLKGENIYAIALVTDSYMESLYLAISTEESLLIQIRKYRREINPQTEHYKSVLRWTPAEWLYDNNILPDSNLKKINNQLCNRNEYSAELEAEYYGVLTDSIITLDKEGLFSLSSKRENIVLFISISDDDKAEAVESCSAKILKKEIVYNKFMQRFKY